MIIKDIVLYFKNGFITTLLKMGRADIDDIVKDEILKNGLYHITKSEETAEMILESQYLRPATGWWKNVNSYGTACVHFFNGLPSVENYFKNLVLGPSTNPYINPSRVITAIKISPRKKEELTNYKIRAFSDNTLIYEGYCILNPEQSQMVYLVPDLVRNIETGEPIINQETGRYDIKLREAQIEELEEDKKTYKAQEDYLQFIEQERERLGYLKGQKFITNMLNTFFTQLHVGRIEGEMAKEHLKRNFPQILKRKLQQFMTPKLDMGTDEIIYNTIQAFNTKNKNPYRDKKFGEAVAEFQKQGFHQLDLKEELKNLTTSENGKYFRQKLSHMDKSLIIQNGIHGISHNNRVALLAMIIAQKEGYLDNDTDNRTKDILLSAAYYHDIGRRKGIIIDNFGAHGKNSAKKIRKMNLTYTNGDQYSAEDRKILQAIIHAHEGKDNDMRKVCEKYKIKESDIQYTMKLMAILKDADALDRVRVDINWGVFMLTDLNPKYLRTNTAKQLLNASYQLETLSKKVSFDRILAYKTEEKKECGIIESKRNLFVERLRQGIIDMPKRVNNIKKMLVLKKESFNGKLKGKNIRNKMQKIISKKRFFSRNKQQKDYEYREEK